MKRLSEKAYGFKDEYRNSNELKELMTDYSVYRVKTDITQLTGGRRVVDVEKPLNQVRDKIGEYLFNTVKSCLK
jgi:hypothetical protein